MILRPSVEDLDPTGGAPSKSFHHRWNYRFKRPVHEALFFSGESEVVRDSNDIVMYHVQDHNKPTRKQYLPLMEVAHKEDPSDAQICFWLGREYMWANRPEQACELLQRYLALPTSNWADERAEAMRYLARMQPEKRMSWLEKARNEAPQAWAFDADARDAFYAAVVARRDIRRFRPDDVPPAVLERILGAAHAAPSVGHSQPWRFVVVRDRATRDRAALLADREWHRQAAHFDDNSSRHMLDLQLHGIRDAPLGVVVCCDRRTAAEAVLGRATFLVPET